MLTTLYKIGYLIIICFTVTGLHAQKKLELSLTYGLSTPTGSYASYKQADGTTDSFGVIDAKTYGFTKQV